MPRQRHWCKQLKSTIQMVLDTMKKKFKVGKQDNEIVYTMQKRSFKMSW